MQKELILSVVKDELKQLGEHTALIFEDQNWSGNQVLGQFNEAELNGSTKNDGRNVNTLSQLVLLANKSNEMNEENFLALKNSLTECQNTVGVFTEVSTFSSMVACSAWSLGLTVHAFSASQSSSKTLMQLERCAINGALVSESTLSELINHPAIALTNLKNLNCIIYKTLQPLPPHLLKKVKNKLAQNISGWAIRDDEFTPIAQYERLLSITCQEIEKQVKQYPTVEHAVVLPMSGANHWAIFAQTYSKKNNLNQLKSPVLNLTVNNVCSNLESEFTEVDFEKAIAVTKKLNQTALLSMLNAFYRLGFFCDQETVYSQETILENPQIAPQHKGLIQRWLMVLEQQQFIISEVEGLRCALPTTEFSDGSLDDAWQQLELAWVKVSGGNRTIEYAQSNAKHLPDLICDKIQAVQLLFPQGSTELAASLYREGIAAQYQQATVRTFLNEIIDQWPEKQTLNILEVGAGTGSTTQALLPVLDKACEKIKLSYQFTDVSTAFTESFFAKHGDSVKRPWLQGGVYNIDKSPRSQGKAHNRYDIVIAGGVFNAAKNTDVSLKGIKEILRPGGWFILTEPTEEEFWVMASQAFMLTHAVDERAHSGATFLSATQWQSALKDADMNLVLDLPLANHPLSKQGHRIFACQVKDNQERLASADLVTHLKSQNPKLYSKIYTEVLDQLPVDAHQQIDKAQLRQWASSINSKENFNEQ